MSASGGSGWVPPETFDDYRVVRPLGRGGMGVVYLGHDLVLDRPVAIKFIASLQPDGPKRRRFLTEARAVARLHHPNVVAVHRAAEVDGRPYLVAELVRGECLKDLAKPQPWDRVLHIGLGLCRGLAAAHRQGVLHRDIKPANAMLSEDDEAKLLDFGLAKLMDHTADPSGDGDDGAAGGPGHTQAGAVLGTPLYMAPEALRGEPATRRSDVYSMGAVLYELCAGRSPRELAAAQGSAATSLAAQAGTGQEERAPPLHRSAPGIDGRLAAVVDRCLEADPGLRFASGDELREALEQLVPRADAAAVPAGNPYRGLHPFEAEHRALFFGRGAEVRDLIERLRGEALVLVAGDSGVGKSSLCKAGVLPALAEGAWGDGRRYRIASMVPGRRPLAALAAALAPHVGLDEEPLCAWLRSEPAALQRALARAAGPVLIFIDQMEELCTLGIDSAQRSGAPSIEEAALLSEALGLLAVRAGAMRVLMTVRGDFWSRLGALPGLGAEVERAVYLLRPLSAEGTREAVVGPARQKGVRFESEGLVAELVERSVKEAGGLPLLQFALAELWEARDLSRQEIPAAALAAIGGVGGALARHADGVLQGLLAAQRQMARRALLRLVTVEGTRRRCSEAELGGAAALPALEALVRGRLLVASEVEGQTVYEVAHEALLSGWGTLRGWLEADAGSRPVRQRVAAAAAEWERLGRAREALWGRRQIKEAQAVEEGDFHEAELAFLTACQQGARRTQSLRLGLALILPALVGFAYSGTRLRARQEMSVLVSAHERRAQVSLVEARSSQDRLRVARDIALLRFDAAMQPDRQAVRTPFQEAERAWADVLELVRQAEESYLRASQALEAALLLDPARHADRALLGDITYERLLLAERFHLPGGPELLRRLENYDAGGRRRQRLLAPPSLSVSAPLPARVALQRYEDDHAVRRLSPVRELGTTPVRDVEVPEGRGSYLVTLSAPGRVVVRYPLVLDRGEQRQIMTDLPAAAAVPPGYVYIPPGTFLFGSGDDEGLRSSYLGTVPLHEMHTGAYLIGRDEVTFADWLAYLQALPARERTLRTPSGGDVQGWLGLREVAGTWELTLQPTVHIMKALQGQPIRYADRPVRAVQDWLHLPVTGISFNDAQAYAAWLSSSGRLLGARPCDEHEWERAARGADDRRYPHGDRLAAEDANYDATYDWRPGGMGPDEVGSHPASASPFGVQDLVGNAFEWVRSLTGEAGMIRGGAWQYSQMTNRVNNRSIVLPTLRTVSLGMRVCADFPLRPGKERP